MLTLRKGIFQTMVCVITYCCSTLYGFCALKYSYAFLNTHANCLKISIIQEEGSTSSRVKNLKTLLVWPDSVYIVTSNSDKIIAGHIKQRKFYYLTVLRLRRLLYIVKSVF